MNDAELQEGTTAKCETFKPVQEMVRVEVALEVNYSKLNEIPTNGTRYYIGESFTSAVTV